MADKEWKQYAYGRIGVGTWYELITWGEPPWRDEIECLIRKLEADLSFMRPDSHRKMVEGDL